jgi:hypothetical protein
VAYFFTKLYFTSGTIEPGNMAEGFIDAPSNILDATVSILVGEVAQGPFMPRAG